jgi:hypothetical protein
MALLVISYAVAIFLTRRSGTPWPLYTVLALSIVHLFAIVFSKAAVLIAAAAATMLAVICWTLWSFSVLTFSWRWIPLLIWAAALAYSAGLGLAVPNEDHRRSSVLFLVMATFIFGMWALFAVNAQYGLGYHWLVSVVLAVIVVAPIGVILANVIAAESDSGLTATVTAVAASSSGYLFVMQFVARALDHILGRLPWSVLGAPPVPQGEPGWFTLFGWKTLMGTIIACIGLAFALVMSIAAEAREVPPSRRDFLRAHIDASHARLAQHGDPVSLAAEHAYRGVLHITRIVTLAVVFLVMVLVRVLEVLWTSARRLALAVVTAMRYVALPIACFSVASLLLLAMTRGIIGYDIGQPGAYGARTLWGGLVFGTLIALVICGAAFGLNVIRSDEPLSLNAIAPALLTAWLCYPIVVICELALVLIGFALHSVGKHVAALGFGPFTFISLIYVFASLLIIAVPALVWAGLNQASRSSSPTLVIGGMALALLGTAACALFYGHAPLTSWLTAIT